MENQVYEPPQSELDEPINPVIPEFYVVSGAKFVILFMLTVGMYSFYWFYKNWSLYKIKHVENIKPVARGVFYIFFVNSLFKYIDASLTRSALRYDWSPGAYASIFVVSVIAGRIADNLSEKGIGAPLSHFVSTLMIPVGCYVLFKAQGAINLSQSDPKGASNSRFTIANYAWCALGMIIWIVGLIGILGEAGALKLEP